MSMIDIPLFYAILIFGQFVTILTQLQPRSKNKTKETIIMKKNSRAFFVAYAAIIAALYVVLTLIANALGLANYAIQIRFSEALTILPYFTPAAIPGLFVGCILSNILTGCVPLDILFGSIATLLGAIFTYKLRKWKYLSPLPPILFNILLVPPVLAFVYKFEGTLYYFMITVGIGEIISCGVLGIMLLLLLEKYRNRLF